jgi:hypothetical protein
MLAPHTIALFMTPALALNLTPRTSDPVCPVARDVPARQAAWSRVWSRHRLGDSRRGGGVALARWSCTGRSSTSLIPRMLC